MVSRRIDRRWWGGLLGLLGLLAVAAWPLLAQGPLATGEPPLAESSTAQPSDPPHPIVTLAVRVPAEVAPGKEIEYRITVTNRSRAAAHHVTVRNPTPANARFVRATPEPTQREPELVWRLGTMEGCARKEIVLVLEPTGTTEVQNCARVQFEHGQCVTTRIGRSAPPPPPPVQGQGQLALRKTGPAEALLFDAVTFRVDVRNNGTAPLTDVVLTDVLPRDMEYVGSSTPPQSRTLLTWNLGTLSPGQQRTIEYQAVSKRTGVFTNLAVVTAAGGLRQESSARVTVVKPDLTLNIQGHEHRYANLPAAYELTIANPGSTPATNVVLSVPLPTGTRLVSASHGGGQVGGEVQWNLGQIGPGVRRAVVMVLAAQAAGEVVVKANVKADRGLQASAEAKTLFQGAAGLTATLTDTDPIAVGQEAPYVFVVRNTGTADATEVRVTATVPRQFQIGPTKGPANARVDVDKVIYEPVTIKAGQEARYEIHVKALKAGDVRFRVDLEAKELTGGPVREEQSTTIYNE